MGQCLTAAADGPFFPDWEFHTLFGLERARVRQIARAWPDGPLDDDARHAVRNALNNLVGYPHGRDDVWGDYIAAPRSRVEALLRHLIASGW